MRWGFYALAILAIGAIPAALGGYVDPLVEVFLPYMPTSNLMYGRMSLIAFLMAVIYGSNKGATLMKAWEWEGVGRSIGLTPMDEGHLRDELSHRDQASIEKPILSGRVRGRRVRARALKSVISSQSYGTASIRPITIVEVDLEESVEEGVIVEPAKGGALLGDSLIDRIEQVSKEVDVYMEDPGVSGIRFTALADPPELSRAVLSGRSRDLLSAVPTFDGFLTHGKLLVGNAEAVFRKATPSYGEKIPDVGGLSVGATVGNALESMLEDADIRGDAKTVTLYVVGQIVLDPSVLNREIKAVVSVAESFERARTRTGPEER